MTSLKDDDNNGGMGSKLAKGVGFNGLLHVHLKVKA